MLAAIVSRSAWFGTRCACASGAPVAGDVRRPRRSQASCRRVVASSRGAAPPSERAMLASAVSVCDLISPTPRSFCLGRARSRVENNHIRGATRASRGAERDRIGKEGSARARLDVPPFVAVAVRGDDRVRHRRRERQRERTLPPATPPPPTPATPPPGARAILLRQLGRCLVKQRATDRFRCLRHNAPRARATPPLPSTKTNSPPDHRGPNTAIVTPPLPQVEVEPPSPPKVEVEPRSKWSR